ncbi:hypothetical protein F2P79_009027 [Pimephales promelas]|nr:hypothetical protein F2P79_009027 [Pimephales promelas]
MWLHVEQGALQVCVSARMSLRKDQSCHSDAELLNLMQIFTVKDQLDMAVVTRGEPRVDPLNLHYMTGRQQQFD